MKKLLLIFLFTAITNYSQVIQEWVARYTGSGGTSSEVAKSIAIDSSGNLYVTGVSGASGIFDAATVKYNSMGVQQWVAPFNPQSGSDYGSIVAVDNNGNTYVTGVSYGGTQTFLDYTTVKYNSAGVQQWMAKYNGPGNSNDEPYSMAVDNSGNVYVTGISEGDHFSTGADCATIKYNAAGVQQWVERYNGPASLNDAGTSVAVDNVGNVYVTGISYDLTTGGDYHTIKYNAAGVQQWLRRCSSSGSVTDIPRSLAVDNSGNVYVTGNSAGDFGTIKYNSSGVQQWVAIYNGPGNAGDDAISLAVDDSGNTYVTGRSNGGSSTQNDYATVKYDSAGVEQWVARYNGPGSGIDEPKALAIDNYEGVYVTGFSHSGPQTGLDYATVKYNTAGVEQWVARYNGPGGGMYNDQPTSMAIDNDENVYVTGSDYGGASTGVDYATIKYSQGLNIISPQADEKWIAGETDTIKWTGGQANQLLDIEYSTDNGNTYSIIKLGVLADSGRYVWKIPKDIVSTKVKIKLTDVNDTLLSITSSPFKIKPYLLTRMSSTGQYDAYSKFRDPYAFGNDSASVWPIEFWQNFDYTGTDPFTGFNYLVGVPVWLLLQTSSSDHSDWVSWVRTFSVPACYYNTSFPPIYSRTALVKWIDFSDEWGGSCFGISTSNILLFKNTTEFQNNYPSFPTSDPLTIVPNDSVRTVINELYTHQFGLEHRTYRASIGLTKTPNQTLMEIKSMLLDDDPLVRTLSIVSNDASDPGGHSIMAYKVEQDTTLSNIFYVFTYDNAYPNNLDSAIIIVDTLANSNNGTWSPIYGWTNWGGTKWFYLRDPAITYFVTPSLPKNQNTVSPFILSENELQILNTRKASIRITDQQGYSSGYLNGVLLNDIPGTIPNIIENGSSGPPIGYDLPTANYSVQMSDYESTKASISFYTGNKSFKIFRNGSETSDNDSYFFDGGVSVSNPDQQTKNVNLLNIVNETTEEKVFFINEVELAQTDSVKIINPDDNTLDLISYGSAKEYQLELNHASQSGLGRFQNNSIQLTQNTTHKLAPNWADLTNSQLTIYVDEGNDGTIDDTLYIANTVDVKDEGGLLTPNEFNLAQNYPNPFNPTTTIRYSIPQRSNVSLKVYDILGNEIATLVNEEKVSGVYTATFDASTLASGMYLYRLQAGSFVETKKMLLVK